MDDDDPDARTPRAVPGRGRSGLGATVAAPPDQRRLQPGHGARRHPDGRRRRAEAHRAVRSARRRRACSTSYRDREWPLLQAMWEHRHDRDPTAALVRRDRRADGSEDDRDGPRRRVRRCSRRSVPGPTWRQRGRSSSTSPRHCCARRSTRLPPAIEQPADWDSYIDSAIDIYVHAETGPGRQQPDHPLRVGLAAGQQAPAVPLAVVHGDFQPGNILIADGHPPVVIDWEFTRIGDPREDVGYYSGSPLPTASTPPTRHVPRRVPRADRLHRGAGQPQVMEYFLILGMAELYVQMMQGADGLSRGPGEGDHVARSWSTACVTSRRGTSTSASPDGTSGKGIR